MSEHKPRERRQDELEDVRERRERAEQTINEDDPNGSGDTYRENVDQATEEVIERGKEDHEEDLGRSRPQRS